MKIIRFFWIFFCISHFFSTGLSAQNKIFVPEVKAGLLVPILTQGAGIQLGFHPVFHLGNYVSIEGQLSYHFTRVTSSFLSGRKRNESYVSGLGGVRLFLHKRERSSRIFVNFLIGKFYVINKSDTVSGISTGLHLLEKKYTVGLVLESPGAIIAKVGYVF